MVVALFSFGLLLCACWVVGSECSGIFEVLGVLVGLEVICWLLWFACCFTIFCLF